MQRSGASGEGERRGWGWGAAPNEIRVRASPPPAATLGLYTARAANGPAVVCGPYRAARRAEASAQARPATCRGPARACFQPCRARPNCRATGHASGPRAACTSLMVRRTLSLAAMASPLQLFALISPVSRHGCTGAPARPLPTFVYTCNWAQGLFKRI